MLLLSGSIALSDFRKRKLVDQLGSVVPDCVALESRYLHIVDLRPSTLLDASETEMLERLLDYGHGVGNPTSAKTGTSLSRVTVPRIGTISPWATKATDITHHCGLDKIYRVERGISWELYFESAISEELDSTLDSLLSGLIFDPMTESCLLRAEHAVQLFEQTEPEPLVTIDVLGGGGSALDQADQEFGFALSEPEKKYLLEQFSQLGRNPTDVELMMFAQVNSEHCRHKIFNADWSVDGEEKKDSLFGMIRSTHKNNSKGTLVAYSDNAAILEGSQGRRFHPSAETREFSCHDEFVHFTAKVETHNHPTAISPFAGASTGSGGEIRDEGATGRGGKPKAGLAGFSVSHLRIPGLRKPWEPEQIKPDRIASPLQIMLEGPIGAAAFNNEFGRPNICGYFRSFEQEAGPGLRHGYHKPIMLAGGLGNIRPGHIHKRRITAGAAIVVLGGPTMLIGLGGGAASSVASGSSSESLDFASVQRGNPEMQRRCQEVIDACCAMGDANPIISIHDVGAGGLCNALPELVHDAERGGAFEIREVLNDEPGMSPMQIWCNESQERYVLAVEPDRFAEFEAICARERCLFARVGEATKEQHLILTDRHFGGDTAHTSIPIDLSMALLFGLPPKMKRDAVSASPQLAPLEISKRSISEMLPLVLSFPAVADKTFLVTIGDRSVTGMIARDQMVGPWQVPVSDVAVTCSDYYGYTGEAMAVGERTPVAVINAEASGRMAIGEALTNLASAMIGEASSIRLSANWMVAAGEPGHDAALYRTVSAVALDLCPQLGLAIPVGKDSMSMATRWQDNDGQEHKVVAPLSLVVTAFSPVVDIRRTCTPFIRLDQGATELWFFDLGCGSNRLGGSVLAQVLGQIGDQAPDVNAPVLKRFMRFMCTVHQQQLACAYHDRSDGGLAATLVEMCFTARCGIEIDIAALGPDSLAILFSEELGAVIQVRSVDRDRMQALVDDNGLGAISYRIGQPTNSNRIAINNGAEILLDVARESMHRAWSEVTWQMQRLRDNPACADQEYDRLLDLDDPGIHPNLTFNPAENIAAPFISGGRRPRIAILREQGVNGQLEMAAAFDRAGFSAIDVTMSDLVDGMTLDDFHGVAACGGFSFGDVLGAGEGWAKSILFNSRLRDAFQEFFERSDTFALGVCNGCQMMSTIKELIPGADHWPRFIRNASEQYEARFVTVSIESEVSILMHGMQGSRFSVSVAHGEGRAWFSSIDHLHALEQYGQVAMRFVDNHHQATERYPFNSNGSPQGVTGFTNTDGRFTIMMPHPERVFRTVAHSWHPDEWQENSPWMRIFQNARAWVA
ncbi:MAG: phosphoribosylformylglycinamidine synthase [Arenicellales bacterium]